jgi:uncharacterized protein (AIM24 family)
VGGDEEVEGLDEEFVFHLTRGSDALARGDAQAARVALARALELRPKDAKILGLLGQACYRLGRFDDAIGAWQRLVEDSPLEPSGRVNLGLAFLRTRRYADAKKQLEIALDLNPDHKKAMAYLGLALLESGEPKPAREWFMKGGSDQMVARCDEILAGGQPAASRPPADAAAEDALEASPAPERLLEPAAGVPLEARADAAPPPATPPSSDLASSAAAWLVAAPEGRTFAPEGGVLAVHVRGGVRLRLDGLFAVQGRVELSPEVKRFRGQATDKPFGAGQARIHRACGEGSLFLSAGERRRFTPVELGAGAAYLREEAVFGLDEGISFENGRVHSQGNGQLHLVQLQGRGEVLLVTAGPPVAMDVTAGAPLRLPIEALVGWVGVLTPRVTTLIESSGGASVPAVELTGEGRVIADPAAARAGEAEA